MPQVPTDSSFNVAPQALPGARVDSIADAADYGGLQAQQLGAVAAGAEQIGGMVQQRQNTDMLFRAESQLKDAALAFHTDQSQRKGVNAWDMTKDATKWWNDQGAKYKGMLENDDQRAAFLKTFVNLRTQGIYQSSTQEANERRGSLEESAKASIVGSINNAAASYATPGVVTSAIDDITQRTQATAKLNGWTPERRDVEMALNLTSLHKQVIGNMVQDDPEQAQRYFDTYKEQIEGSQRDSVEKVIKGAKFTTAAQAFAAQVTGSDMTETDAIAAARSKFAGPEQEQVVLEVKTRYREKSQAREDVQKDAADTAYGIYARSGRISAIPQTVLDKLDGRVLISLQHEAQSKAAGTAVKTDPNAYYELRKMAADDPSGFAKLDLRTVFNKLDEGDREKFINLQTEVKKPAKQTEVAALSSQLSDAHDLQGWKASDGPKKGAFDRAVTDAIDQEQTRAGKPLSFSERQAVIDRMMIEGKVGGRGFLGIGGAAKFYEVTGTPDADKFAPKVPDMDKAQITAALTKRGVPVTPDAILRLYKQKNGLQ